MIKQSGREAAKHHIWTEYSGARLDGVRSCLGLFKLTDPVLTTHIHTHKKNTLSEIGNSQNLFIQVLASATPDLSGNLEMKILEKKGKLEYPEKILSKQG